MKDRLTLHDVVTVGDETERDGGRKDGELPDGDLGFGSLGASSGPGGVDDRPGAD